MKNPNQYRTQIENPSVMIGLCFFDNKNRASDQHYVKVDSSYSINSNENQCNNALRRHQMKNLTGENKESSTAILEAIFHKEYIGK